MLETPASFNFEYTPTKVVYGRGCVAQLAEVLDNRGLERALVVCGSNVAANQDIMDPIETGLDDKLVDIFSKTTPEKYLGTVLDGVNLMYEKEIDAVVGLGGGSSLNVARAMCSIAPLNRSRVEIIEEVIETQEVPSPNELIDPTPNIAIPTTMPGADISSGGSVVVNEEQQPESTGSGRVDANLSDSRLMPEANFYDPNLYATTPMSVLAPSAMNGFDKGIETLYSRTTTPIANAHAIKGLQHYRAGLPDLVEADRNDPAYDHAVLATLLVQYGRKTNIIHTFGNGISLHYDIQQGAVHGIMAPHVLRYVFDNTDSHRYQIAEGLKIETSERTDEDIADAIIENVIQIRNALNLPIRLQDIEGMKRTHFEDVAKEILDNYKHTRNPPGIDPTTEEIISILETAW